MTQTRRGSYHHGDLANALLTAATELARGGGPEAVVLREAARHVGVSATAAYRHFAGHGDLIHAVKERAQAAVAASMESELAASPPLPDPGEDAVRRLRAIGTGYIRFALTEPGLFRTAFCRTEPKEPHDLDDGWSYRSYQLLAEVLDDLVVAGRMDPARRPYSEVPAWSAAHGLALLLLDGPLAALPEPAREAAIVRTIDVIIEGICDPVTG